MSSNGTASVPRMLILLVRGLDHSTTSPDTATDPPGPQWLDQSSHVTSSCPQAQSQALATSATDDSPGHGSEPRTVDHRTETDSSIQEVLAAVTRTGDILKVGSSPGPVRQQGGTCQ
eukprot:2705744-Rhodomonas_salina.2